MNKIGRFADPNTPGLYVQCSPRGDGTVTRSFLFRYSFAGKSHDMRLGSCATTSLAEARQAIAKARALIQDGQDPVTFRQRKRAETLAAASVPTQTFEQATKDWLAVKASGWKNGARDAAAALSPIRRYLFPTLGNLDVRLIQHDHMVATLKPLMRAHPDTGVLVRARAEAILAAAAAQGFRDPDQPNPARKEILRHALPSKTEPVRHYAAPPLDQAPALFQRIAAVDDSTQAVIAFLILTTTRLNEPLGARWDDEIDLDRCLWTIPAARTKKAREHQVPLTARMLAILDRQAARRIGPFIFPGRHPGSPMNPSTPRTALTEIGGAGITLHGFRSTWRDWAGDHGGVLREVAEMQLAHDIGDATEMAYRRERALAQRRAALEAYGDWLAGAEAVVIPFARAAG